MRGAGREHSRRNACGNVLRHVFERTKLIHAGIVNQNVEAVPNAFFVSSEKAIDVLFLRRRRPARRWLFRRAS